MVKKVTGLHYGSGPNCAELNRAGPAVQTSSVLLLFTLSKKTGLTCAGPQKCASVNVVRQLLELTNPNHHGQNALVTLLNNTLAHP